MSTVKKRIIYLDYLRVIAIVAVLLNHISANWENAIVPNSTIALIYNAFVYQVAKDIGAQATVLNGKVDRIIFTGGIAYQKSLIEDMEKKVGFIAPFTVYPGEDEMLALCQGALRVLNGEEEAKVY